MIDFNFL